MKLLRIQASNFGTFATLDLDVREAPHAVIVGENGTGKSLIMDAVCCALHGDCARGKLSEMIARDGVARGLTDVTVGVEVEHLARVHRITRTWSGRTKTGKSTSDLAELVAGEWVSRPIAEADARLGVLEAARYSTTFLRSYGIFGIGDFGVAKAGDRRKLLKEMRSLDHYDGLAKGAREETRAETARAEAAEVARAEAVTFVAACAQAAVDADARRAELPAVRERIAAAEREAGALRERLGALGAGDGQLTELRKAWQDAGTRRASENQRRVALKGRIDALWRVAVDRPSVLEAAALAESLRPQLREARAARAALEPRRTAASEARLTTAQAVTVARQVLTDAKARNERAREAARVAAEVAPVKARVEGLRALLPHAQARDAAAAAVAAGVRPAQVLGRVPCQAMEGYDAWRKACAACEFIADAGESVRLAKAAEGERDRIAATLASLGAPNADARTIDRQASDAGRALYTLEGRAHQLADAGAEVDLGPLDDAIGAAVSASAAAGAEWTAVEAAVREADALCESLLSRGKDAAAVAARLPEIDRADADIVTTQTERDGLTSDDVLAPAVEAARVRLAEAEDASRGAATLREAIESHETAASIARDAVELLRVDAGTLDATAGKRAWHEARAAEHATAKLDAERKAAVARTLAEFYAVAPTLILEHDLATVEATANEWLRRTSGMSLRLATQAVCKNGNTAETLDVLVSKDGHERARETYSGAELFRVDLATAIGLGAAFGGGAPFLWTDEGFGACRPAVMTQVVEALRDAIDSGVGLWCIAHEQPVIDLFPARIEVRGGARGSEVTTHA